MNLLKGIASHWKYKSSEKFSELSWKEYDWLRDLVEIIEAGTSLNITMSLQNQMFQENVFCLLQRCSNKAYSGLRLLILLRLFHKNW